MNRNNGDYFILIYFGLWSINSLPESLSAGVFQFHESFLLLQKPSFLLHHLDLALPFLRCSPVGPPFLQELPCGGTTVILALRPEGVKCFLQAMVFPLLLFPSFQEVRAWNDRPVHFLQITLPDPVKKMTVPSRHSKQSQR